VDTTSKFWQTALAAVGTVYILALAGCGDGNDSRRDGGSNTNLRDGSLPVDNAAGAGGTIAGDGPAGGSGGNAGTEGFGGNVNTSDAAGGAGAGGSGGIVSSGSPGGTNARPFDAAAADTSVGRAGSGGSDVGIGTGEASTTRHSDDAGQDAPAAFVDGAVDLPVTGSGGIGGQPEGAGGNSGGSSGGTTSAGGTTSTGFDAGACSGPQWLADESNNPIVLGFGSGASFPQFAAIDASSSYARFVYGPSAGWGTSIILAPSFWTSDEIYHQGTPIDVQNQIACDHIQLTFSGTIAGLAFTGTLQIDPPADDRLVAHVQVTTTGVVSLAGDQPSQTFKPLMFSTMHESDTRWDASSVLIGANSYSIPLDGWLVPSPISATHFGVIGGTSAWKTNAPTVVIDLAGVSSPQVTGWMTPSSDPNDDNGSLWAATTEVPSSWSYDITVTK
jgi:hypothetical protein